VHSLLRALPLALVAGVALFLGSRAEPQTATACAFDPLRPAAYEADALRSRYLLALDGAATNQLFPNDSYFRTPQVETGTRNNRVDGPRALPVEVLRAIGWVESSLTMASRSTRFESIGPALVSFDCGHGVMQVTSGMTVPLGSGNQPTENQVAVATSYPHNIARGAVILASKWNNAPQLRPIVGTDTGGDPAIIENWYYAVWAYNGFTGPGSKKSNHPLDPTLSWPRAGYVCDGTQSRTRYPYQELVWGCMANPAEREDRQLWAAVPATLPDFSDPQFYDAVRLNNFTFPYRDMDIPTPRPAHQTSTPSVSNVGALLLGNPRLSVDQSSVTIRANGTPDQAVARIRVRNTGTGLLSWSATSSDGFLVVTPPAGSAVGSGVPCTSGDCPAGEIEVTINPSLLPASRATATITISSPNASGSTTVRVQVFADFEVAAPGASRAP
jgi:hypothetical protein